MAADGGFGPAVRRLRRRLTLSQEELADRAEIDPRTVRTIEGGRSTPRGSTLRRLADALELDGDERIRFLAGAADRHTGRPEPTSDPPRGGPVPAQLPPDVSAFVGRGPELDRLTGWLAGAPDVTGLPIGVVSGPAGVGKTALAVRSAHRVRDRFPDGQLYVNLRGYDPDEPVSPADALAGLLRGLGVRGEDLPADLAGREACYRSTTAGRRMLVVLDNAGTVAQVRPLLPGTGSCAVLVTSRDSLAGLVALNGAHRLDLDLLPAPDAVALLRELVGTRVDAEPEVAATLVEQCARLPLALRVAAEIVVSSPATRLAELVADLGDRRLAGLDTGEDEYGCVAAVFSWSLRRLAPEVVGVFRLLGLPPGADIDVRAAAALAGTDVAAARRALARLAHGHLLQPTGPGRYGMHDLLRAYATGLCTAEDAEEVRRAALTRLFDYYAAAAAAAAHRMVPTDYVRSTQARPARSGTPPAVPVPVFDDASTAQAWLDAERHCLVDSVRFTAERGWPEHTAALSTALFRYLESGHLADALTVFAHARDAARRVADLAGQADALLGLGAAQLRSGHYAAATAHVGAALDLLRRTGNRAGEARALGYLGTIEQRLGRYRPAAGYHQRSLELYRHSGNRAGEAIALTSLGIIERRLGHPEHAATRHGRALTLFRETGDRTGEAHALDNLGVVEVRLGACQAAAAHHRQALDLFRELGNLTGEATALDNLGTAQTRLGHPEQATASHRRALALFRGVGARDGEPWALNGLGEAALAAGDPAAAVDHHTAALDLATETGVRDQQGRAHAGLARAYRALGEDGRAYRHDARAVTLTAELGMADAGQGASGVGDAGGGRA